MNIKFFYPAILLMAFVLVSCHQEPVFKTICNPVNFGYCFQNDEPSRRESADPSMVLFKNEFYLFASKVDGYMHSTDLVTWNRITTADLPVDDYAPTAVVIDDEIYFMASGRSSRRIYKTADPQSGKWELFNGEFPFTSTDPMFFLDDDGRVYFYWGCSDRDPIMAVELDRNNRLNPKGEPVVCLSENREVYGWEVVGDYNEMLEVSPWIEGAWMNKYNGKYYLQYSGPGTEFKSYADAVYVSDRPLGPFTLANVNPFAWKPEGFTNGAGHGSSFNDKYGNRWHIGTSSISVKHKFERRLSLFPVFFDQDGEMMAYTGFGDYPVIVPDKKVDDVMSLFTGWMLLSYNKKVEVSSSLEGYPAQNAVNEDIRTYWSAKTGDRGEFISVDLGAPSLVYAIQTNFAEQGFQLFGCKNEVYYQYLLEYSDDGKKWKKLVDKSNNTTDAPHDYIQLAKPVKTRYIRLTNLKVPDGNFAVSGLRVFGTCDKKPAQAVSEFKVDRGDDRRTATLSWNYDPDAVGYNIRFGTQPDKLYQNYMVYGKNELHIRSLNADRAYYFAIDAFNESGVSEGKTVQKIL